MLILIPIVAGNNYAIRIAVGHLHKDVVCNPVFSRSLTPFHINGGHGVGALVDQSPIQKYEATYLLYWQIS
jgi:hypothetical protein